MDRVGKHRRSDWPARREKDAAAVSIRWGSWKRCSGWLFCGFVVVVVVFPHMVSFRRVPDSALHRDPRYHLMQEFEPSVALSINTLAVVRGCP